MTKWLLWLSESFHLNVHKGIPKQYAKFGPNRISNSGDINFYRKIGLVWFALVWFGSVCFFVVQNIKLCLEKWYVKFENNWLRNGWDMTQNVLLYLVKIVWHTYKYINISLSRSNVYVADIAWKHEASLTQNVRQPRLIIMIILPGTKIKRTFPPKTGIWYI